MASLFSALTTAVAGLNAQSSAIGNISDNLANAQTTGYKSVGTGFEELVNSSSATVNNPGGVKATPSYQNDVQGSITSSNTATNMAISGQGYFQVLTAASGGTTLYTREGDFTLNKDGYLVNGSGFYLAGYTYNGGSKIDSSATNPIQISSTLQNPVASSKLTYSANLPSNATAGYVSSTQTVLVYDAQGATHAVNYTWTKTSTTNQWDLQVTIPDATVTTVVPFTFNNGSLNPAGTLATGGITAYASSTAAPTAYTVGSNGTSADISLSATFGSLSAQSLDLNFGNYNASNGVTQFADTSTAVTTNNFSQDGLPKGSFNSLSISSDGFVSINYSNGTNKSIAQVPIAQFYAQDQLQRVTGGAYSTTLASGDARVGVPGVSGAGTISSSSLELSNVDIAAQFTNLIQAQQVYSANAKIVTTDNQLLQITVNMVQ